MPVFWEATTLERYLGSEQLEKLDADERTMAEGLHSALSTARDSAEPAVIERLHEALRRMVGGPHGTPAPCHPAFKIVVSACEILARRGSLRPGTEMGDLVVETLLAAADLGAEDFR